MADNTKNKIEVVKSTSEALSTERLDPKDVGEAIKRQVDLHKEPTK